MASGMKELLQRKIYIKKHFLFFKKWQFEEFKKRMNGGYQMIWKCKLWRLKACIKRKVYCFEDFNEMLAGLFC